MTDLLELLEHPLGLPKGAFKGVQRAMLERIALLAESIYEQKRSVIIVFEGWDAAGKGTTIRALTERLDARGYKVLATQAPRTHEKQKPWLWRFWMNIPRYGQIAIFDRSWYGRVLVERVYGLTPMPDWIAAYEEINQFERTLADDGTILLKFWLHISRREQLRRFIELTQQQETAWQVTAEDWENHRRYDDYVAAVRDMLASTNTPCAPWFPIDATNREFRMYSVCRTLIERLEEALGSERSHWPSAEALAADDAESLRANGAKGDKKEKRKGQKQAKEPKDYKEHQEKEKQSVNGQAGTPAIVAQAEDTAQEGDKQKKKHKDKSKDKAKDKAEDKARNKAKDKQLNAQRKLAGATDGLGKQPLDDQWPADGPQEVERA